MKGVECFDETFVVTEKGDCGGTGGPGWEILKVAIEEAKTGEGTVSLCAKRRWSGAFSVSGAVEKDN